MAVAGRQTLMGVVGVERIRDSYIVEVVEFWPVEFL
jgi:hypothetical protein